jgi:hypothetical protein
VLRAEVLPAEPIDLLHLTAAQVLELCPDAETEIDGHEHDCPATTLAPDSAFPEPSAMPNAAAYPTVDESFTRTRPAGPSVRPLRPVVGW